MYIRNLSTHYQSISDESSDCGVPGLDLLKGPKGDKGDTGPAAQGVEFDHLIITKHVRNFNNQIGTEASDFTIPCKWQSSISRHFLVLKPVQM